MHLLVPCGQWADYTAYIVIKLIFLRVRTSGKVRKEPRIQKKFIPKIHFIRKISIYLFTCLLFEKIEGFFVLHSS